MLEKRSDKKPYLLYLHFTKIICYLQTLIIQAWHRYRRGNNKASLHKNIDITENEDELYHQYYNSFFKA